MSNHVSNTRKIVKEIHKKRPSYLDRPLFILPSDLEEIMKVDDSTHNLLKAVFGDEGIINNPVADYHAYTYLEPLKLALLEEKVPEFFVIEAIYKNYSPQLVERLSYEFPTSELLYGDIIFGLYKRYDDFLEALKNNSERYMIEDEDEDDYEKLIVRVKKYEFNSVFFPGALEMLKKYNLMISKRITWTKGKNIVTEINPNLDHDICYSDFNFIDLVANYSSLFVDNARLVVVLNEGAELETTMTFNFKRKTAMRFGIAIDTLYTNISDLCINPPIIE